LQVAPSLRGRGAIELGAGEQPEAWVDSDLVEDVEETRTAGLKGGGHLERGAIVQLTGLEFDHLAERADAKCDVEALVVLRQAQAPISEGLAQYGARCITIVIGRLQRRRRGLAGIGRKACPDVVGCCHAWTSLTAMSASGNVNAPA